MFGKSKNKNDFKYGSIEVNLVPDVKYEFIKAEIMRSRVTTISVLAIIASAALVALTSLVTFGLQGYLINSVDKKIEEQFSIYKNYEGVNQILTIQNQLSKIGPLHQDKPISSRLFNMMVSIIEGSSSSVRISRLDYNAATNDIQIEGQSRDGFIGTEKLQKSIIATTLSYKEEDDEDDILVPLTDKVVINEASTYGQDSTGAQVLMFNIGFVANEIMFDFDKDITLVGPDRQDVTDSTTVIPQNIFAPKASVKDDDNKTKIKQEWGEE